MVHFWAVWGVFELREVFVAGVAAGELLAGSGQNE